MGVGVDVGVAVGSGVGVIRMISTVERAGVTRSMVRSGMGVAASILRGGVGAGGSGLASEQPTNRKVNSKNQRIEPKSIAIYV